MNQLHLPAGKKVYLSGPMTGKPNHNREAFDQAAKRLREAGYVVVSPPEINDAMGFTSCEEYSTFIRADYQALVKCDAIYMLRGWQFSTGANKEIQKAIDMALPVFFEESEPKDSKELVEAMDDLQKTYDKMVMKATLDCVNKAFGVEPK